MPKTTKNIRNLLKKTISDRKEKQLEFLEDNKEANIDVVLVKTINTPQFMIASLIMPILYYFLIKKYTDNILQNPNCTCVLEEYITDIKKKSFYLIIGTILLKILKFVKAPQIFISIISIIVFITLILVFINWNNITKNIKKNNCECADTKIKNLISFIAWTQIILLSIGPLLAIIMFFMILINKINYLK
jgi:di/tricarboxylate transporter